MRKLFALFLILFHFSVFAQDIIVLKSGDELKGEIVWRGITQGEAEIVFQESSTSPARTLKLPMVIIFTKPAGTRLKFIR